MTKRQKVRARMFNKISEFEQSGLSKSVFCQKHRISLSLFHYWMKRYYSTPNAEGPQPSFMPVMIEDIVTPNDNGRIVVTGNGGLQVSFPAKAASIPLIRQLLEG